MKKADRFQIRPYAVLIHRIVDTHDDSVICETRYENDAQDILRELNIWNQEYTVDERVPNWVTALIRRWSEYAERALARTQRHI